MILTIASGKGGVGKTSTAIAIAAAFKERNLRPILVDLDSGGDATWSLGFDAADGALDVIEKRRTIAAALIESDEGLLLLPGSPALVRLEDGDVGQLAKRLRALGSGDDLLVIDTAPGFSAVTTRAAIAAARKVAPHGLKIEIEITNVAELKQAIGERAEVIMLDNFSPEAVRSAMGFVEEADYPVVIECSGGISESTAAAYAVPGVHLLSVGGLTHSVTALDLSLLVL